MKQKLWIAVDVALIILFLTLTQSCGNFWSLILGPFHPGHEIPYQVTPDDTLRAHNVQVCLTDWARAYFSDPKHSDDSLSHVIYAEPVSNLVIMRVDGDGVISTDSKGNQRQVDAAERSDTLLVSHWIKPGTSKWIALLYHESLHIPQSRHRELIGQDGDIHWAPPWDYCHIQRLVIG